MSSDNFWARVKSARMVQVLVAYTVVAWGIIQVTDIFQESLALPPWMQPVTLILLVIGFVIIGATAWVQSHPATAERAARDEIPEPWELQASEIPQALAKGRLPHLTWARSLLGGGVAFLLLFGFAGLYVVIKDRGQSFAPTEAIASDDALPGVAVLPFSVSGGELDEWREGMVNLLSTNLDGAAGLRAINSRTVLARWDETVGDATRVDEETSLRVAQAARARYALMGSAVGIGPSVRLTADVYDVETGERLGQAQVEGSPDSVLVLVDRLSIEVISAIVRGRGELPSFNLASVTTASVPALKAYLEGEAAFRRADFAAAIEPLERAVEIDSTFAFAYYRLASAYGWKESVFHPLYVQYRDRAAALVDRLPERQALFVRIEHATYRYEGLELARDAVRRYPDDPQAWSLLGEFHFHAPELSLASFEDTDEAFARAVELDPLFAPNRIHGVDLAFAGHDSALAARRLAEFESSVAVEGKNVRRGQLGIALAFGDSAELAWARQMLDTLELSEVVTGLGTVFDVHPLSWRFKEEMAQELKRRGEFERLHTGALRSASWLRGAWAEYLSRQDDPPGACTLMWLHKNGMPVSDALVDSALAPAAVDTSGLASMTCAALHAANRGRWDDHAALVVRLEEVAQDALANADSSRARRAAGLAGYARGYAQVKQGQPEGFALVESARRDGVFSWTLELIGDLYMEAEKYEDAGRYYRAAWNTPTSYLKLGRVYAQLGEREKARDAYATFIQAWANADPELQPFVEDARRSMEQLGTDVP